MKADNDNRPALLKSDPFANLPLFATDKELATAIVGKMRAAQWVKDTFPTLAVRPGFPRVDAFHGGRPVPLVRLFYESYLGLSSKFTGHSSQSEDRVGTWKKSKRSA